jgi:hypothetical protein
MCWLLREGSCQGQQRRIVESEGEQSLNRCEAANENRRSGMRLTHVFRRFARRADMLWYFCVMRAGPLSPAKEKNTVQGL